MKCCGQFLSSHYVHLADSRTAQVHHTDRFSSSCIYILHCSPCPISQLYSDTPYFAISAIVTMLSFPASNWDKQFTITKNAFNQKTSFPRTASRITPRI